MNLSRLQLYPDRQTFCEAVVETVYQTGIKSHGCDQVVVQVFMEKMGIEDKQLFKAASLVVQVFMEQIGIEDKLLSKTASLFPGEMALTGNACGALQGSLMMMSMVFDLEELSQGLTGLLSGAHSMRKLIKIFEGNNQGKLSCRDITGIDIADPQQFQEYFETGGRERCARLMADTSAAAAALIYDHVLCKVKS